MLLPVKNGEACIEFLDFLYCRLWAADGRRWARPEAVVEVIHQARERHGDEGGTRCRP